MNVFSDIIGQPRAAGALGRAIAAGRLFPSLIFHGPGGSGKLTAALSLGRSLLCPAEAGGPCDACSTCRRIDGRALVHPDVRLVLPEKLSDFEKGEPRSESAAGIDAQELQAEAIRNPVWTILIDRIRQSLGAVQRPPAEGRRSILIIDQAHRMPAEPANALLKTLEEPPSHAIIVLLTPSLHALLPTIRSRCQAVPFRPVARLEIAAFLMERHGLPEDEAVLRAGLSGGRVGAALELDLDAYRRRRGEILETVEEIVGREDPGIAVARAESMARGGEDLDADLGTLMSLLRDLMLIEAADPAAAGAGTRLIHVDIKDRLEPLAVRLGARAARVVESLDATLAAIRRRGHRQLLLENLFLELLPDPPAGAAARAT